MHVPFTLTPKPMLYYFTTLITYFEVPSGNICPKCSPQDGNITSHLGLCTVHFRNVWIEAVNFVSL